MRKSFVVAVLTGLAVLQAAPAQAAASGGYVRLAHLSPDTPEVDVYLNSQSGATKEQIFRGVGYGVMSNYLSLPAGGYTVAMRLAGAPASEPPVLTTQVSLTAGSAYTVAGVGRHAELGLRVIQDDLSLPAGNKAKVRIVQASVRAPILGVSVVNGPSIAANVAFATTTPYHLVDPGDWKLHIRPATGAGDTQIGTKLAAGNVYSLLILDAKTSGLRAELRVDARRQGGIPEGGVQTGGGGTQRNPLWWAVPVPLLIGGLMLWRVRARSR